MPSNHRLIMLLYNLKRQVLYDNGIYTMRWKQICLLMILLMCVYACKGPQRGRDTVTTRHDKPLRLTIPHHPLNTSKDLDVLLKAIGDDRIVFLGGGSHGSSDYYTWRTAITKRLIEEKGFDFIAVEGAWADTYQVNKFIKGAPQDSTALLAMLNEYRRWPNWMWNNAETASLVSWLNRHNQSKATAAKIGFFGIDIFDPWETLDELELYLAAASGADQQAMLQDTEPCFDSDSTGGQEYAMSIAHAPPICREKIERMWRSVQQYSNSKSQKTEADFVAEQHAHLARNGERYYTSMAGSAADSWNIRDEHMTATLKRLLAYHGPESKVVIWAHNSHVGDARYTSMEADGLINMGELARKEWGENVFIVGFGSYKGSVIAAEAWGAPLKIMEVPAASPGSWEELLHQLSPKNKIILSSALEKDKDFDQPIPQRAIGVVYQPQNEQHYNYIPSIVHQRYDAFLFLDQTQSLHPLGTATAEDAPPDLYPWGY